MSSRVKVTFIVSAGRSGQHYLMSLLDGHPQISCIPSEMRFYRSWQMHGCDGMTDPERVVDTILQRFRLRQPRALVVLSEAQKDWSRIDFDALRTSFIARLRSRGVSRRNALLALHEAFFEGQGRDVSDLRAIVEVTGFADVVSEELADFPDASFLHTIRHPRAMCASKKLLTLKLLDGLFNPRQRTWGEMFVLNLDHALNIRHLRATYALQAMLPAERFFCLRYEDLTSDLDATATRLSRWLGVDDTESLRTPTMLGEPFLGNSSFTDAPVADGAQVARRSATHAVEDRAVELLYYRHMEFVGYQPQHVRRDSGTFARMLAVLAWCVPFRHEVGWILNRDSRAFSDREPCRPFLKRLWQRSPWVVRAVRLGLIPYYLLRNALVFPLQRLFFFRGLASGLYTLDPEAIERETRLAAVHQLPLKNHESVA